MAALAAPSRALAPLSVLHVPRATLPCMAECAGAPDDPQRWQQRHRDLPCTFRDARALYTAPQRAELDALFAPGWQCDPGHPILSCVGLLRAESVAGGAGDDAHADARHCEPGASCQGGIVEVRSRAPRATGATSPGPVQRCAMSAL